MGDDRLADLRRRVAADPASIAFAHLAEECRRAGAADEAAAICRNGLVRYPDYLSARVTLGRALLELGRLEEAQGELEIVVAAAPDNLPAIRGLAEIHQRRGRLETALDFYRRALGLARHDAELAETVGRIAQEVAPPATPAAQAASIEDLFDFDGLLEKLGGAGTADQEGSRSAAGFEPPPPVPAATGAQTPRPLAPPVAPVAADPFAALEQEIRLKADQHARAERDLRLAFERRRVDAVVGPLEAWLAAIVADREARLRP